VCITHKSNFSRQTLVFLRLIWYILLFNRAINTRLPRDISVRSVFLHPDPKFEPRQNVKMKTYKYRIRFHRILKDKEGNILPICMSGAFTLRGCNGWDSTDQLWFVPWALDATALKQVCTILSGEHDFSAFVHKEQRAERDHTLTIRMDAIFHENDDDATPSATNVTFVLESPRFRRSMVRNLVGFVVDVCRGKPEAVKVLGGMSLSVPNAEREIFVCKDAALVVHSAPACGLCLEKVIYEGDNR